MPTSSTPRITGLRVIPVAGRDSMLLNLSGAHGPFFTRNLLILDDDEVAREERGVRAAQVEQHAVAPGDGHDAHACHDRRAHASVTRRMSPTTTR